MPIGIEEVLLTILRRLLWEPLLVASKALIERPCPTDTESSSSSSDAMAILDRVVVKLNTFGGSPKSPNSDSDNAASS
jgi:hypothetical protein